MSENPLDYKAPQDFPTAHFTAVTVPADFAEVIRAAAEKGGILFEDQLLSWAQAGAECSRLHREKNK